jgi:glycosyltransferase involved in cell wall biosynthesis
MENQELELTILIPALNEEKTIEIVIQKAWTFIYKNGIQAEILVANNGSTDQTKEIAKKNKARVIDVPKRGYGEALREGIKQAKGQYIIFRRCRR